MNKNIDEILQLKVEEIVIIGCTEGLKVGDYYEIREFLFNYRNYKDNLYYKKLENVLCNHNSSRYYYDDDYIFYLWSNSSLLLFVLANNTHDRIKLYSTDSFMFLCQFHREKTPSLGVTNHVNLMYCFGCGFGANIFKYIQEYENISFKEALSLVAEVYNLEKSDVKVNKALIDKYKESIMSNRYLELIEQGIERLDDRKDRGIITSYDDSARKAYNKNLIQRQAIIDNKRIEDYPKDKIYTKVYLDSSYLE